MYQRKNNIIGQYEIKDRAATHYYVGHIYKLHSYDSFPAKKTPECNLGKTVIYSILINEQTICKKYHFTR